MIFHFGNWIYNFFFFFQMKMYFIQNCSIINNVTYN